LRDIQEHSDAIGLRVLSLLETGVDKDRVDVAALNAGHKSTLIPVDDNLASKLLVKNSFDDSSNHREDSDGTPVVYVLKVTTLWNHHSSPFMKAHRDITRYQHNVDNYLDNASDLKVANGSHIDLICSRC